MPPKLVKQIIGAAAGVIVGLMMLSFGFFKTLLLAALGALGWWLCGSRSLPQPVKDLAERIRNHIPRL